MNFTEVKYGFLKIVFIFIGRRISLMVAWGSKLHKWLLSKPVLAWLMPYLRPFMDISTSTKISEGEGLLWGEGLGLMQMYSGRRACSRYGGLGWLKWEFLNVFVAFFSEATVKSCILFFFFFIIIDSDREILFFHVLTNKCLWINIKKEIFFFFEKRSHVAS